jgi:hypothetical protein
VTGLRLFETIRQREGGDLNILDAFALLSNSAHLGPLHLPRRSVIGEACDHSDEASVGNFTIISDFLPHERYVNEHEDFRGNALEADPGYARVRRRG